MRRIWHGALYGVGAALGAGAVYLVGELALFLALDAGRRRAFADAGRYGQALIEEQRRVNEELKRGRIDGRT